MIIIGYDILPLILYLLGITLLVVLIILGIRLIGFTDKLDDILKDISGKSKKLDGVFDVIDRTTDGISSISDRVVDGLSSIVLKIFKKKYNKNEEEEDNE